MHLKKTFRQIHLWLAIPIGLFISIICLTGAILVFEKEIVQGLNPQVEVTSLPKGDPARKELRGAAFFQQTRALHRWLLDPPARKGDKSAGKVIVGVSTAAMAFILVSGIVVWCPRNRKVLENRLKVSTGKGWRRFCYDSHVSLGFYAAVVLLLTALTGLTWSFRWYHEWAYSLFGDMQPKAVKHLLYSLHVGSWGGVWTQVVYFLAALIGGILPLSGYYLWWKRRQ